MRVVYGDVGSQARSGTTDQVSRRSKVSRAADLGSPVVQGRSGPALAGVVERARSPLRPTGRCRARPTLPCVAGRGGRSFSAVRASGPRTLGPRRARATLMAEHICQGCPMSSEPPFPPPIGEDRDPTRPGPSPRDPTASSAAGRSAADHRCLWLRLAESWRHRGCGC